MPMRKRLETRWSGSPSPVVKRQTQTATRCGTGMPVRSAVSSLATASPSASQTMAKVARPIRKSRRESASGYPGLLRTSHHLLKRSLTQRRRWCWCWCCRAGAAAAASSPMRCRLGGGGGAVSGDTTSSSSSSGRRPLLSSRKGSARRWGAAAMDAVPQPASRLPSNSPRRRRHPRGPPPRRAPPPLPSSKANLTNPLVTARLLLEAIYQGISPFPADSGPRGRRSKPRTSRERKFAQLFQIRLFYINLSGICEFVAYQPDANFIKIAIEGIRQEIVATDLHAFEEHCFSFSKKLCSQ